jgi:hypothetical protein
VALTTINEKNISIAIVIDGLGKISGDLAYPVREAHIHQSL